MSDKGEVVERQSLEDIEEILRHSRKLRIKLLLIGGYAVATVRHLTF